jgi:hypothetical protein
VASTSRDRGTIENFNPCDNTYAGVGTSTQGPFEFSQGPYDFYETVEGTFDPATTAFTFIATVTGVEPQNPADPSFLSATGIDLVGYEWRSDAPFTRRFPDDPFPADGTWHSNRFGGEAGSTATLTYWQVTGTKGYRNHGQYVKANKGVDDAAHSCIGMPTSP